MRKNKMKDRLFFILLILFLCLLFLIVALLNVVKYESSEDVFVSFEETEKKPQNVDEVMDKYESKHVRKESDDTIYATLSKDLYNEDGSSNEKFINDIMNELEPFYDGKDFYVVDQNRQIVIKSDYNPETDNRELIINGVSDFYEKTDGDTFVAVEKSKIVKGSNFPVREYVLNQLEVNNGYFSHVEKNLGEGEDLGNGYKSYVNGLIKVRTVDTGSMRHILFDKDYETFYTTDIHSSMTLDEILQLEPNNDFGSLNEKYLGYRQQNFYLFFYPDEVSVYAYGYRENEKFEWALKEYIQDGDLGKFVTRIKDKWKVYDEFEYDEETQSDYILISTRGVEIDIKDNDSKGIKLYTNYYFTDYTRRLAKSGLISFVPNTDLVNKVEKERRTNESLND